LFVAVFDVELGSQKRFVMYSRLVLESGVAVAVGWSIVSHPNSCNPSDTNVLTVRGPSSRT
jgi:hypothetical protein